MLPVTPNIRFGEPIIELPLVDSTNIYAMEQVKQGLALSGSCYTTPFQTKGKGQMGKFWESEEDKNILISYVLGLEDAQPQHQFGLSVAVSLGLYDFFNKLGGDETTIKWPNDLYWRDRKAGGILIENVLRGTHWTWSVIGLGININQTQFSAEVPHPVSLQQITGKVFDIKQLQQDLSQHLSKRIEAWKQGEFETLLTMYNSILYKRGQIQKFKQGNIQFEATIVGVNSKGQLVLNQGIEQVYDFGTIQWII